MPKKLEDKLKHEVNTNPKYKDLPEGRKNAIIYGVMRKTGWKPGEGGDPATWTLSSDEKALAENLYKSLYIEMP